MTLSPLTDLLRGAGQLGFSLCVEPDLIAREGISVRELATPPYDTLNGFVQQAAERSEAPIHVGATLWWKSYAYWTTLPIALGWALNRTFPGFTPENTLVSCFEPEPHLMVGITELDEAKDVRQTLVNLHTPLIDALHKSSRAGKRNLWGSVAESLTQPLVAFKDFLPPGADPAAILAEAGRPVSALMDLDPPRRRTCCLYMTLPGKEACDTCCFTSPQHAER